MMRIFGTVLAGLFGLAFGSFLNVCLSRWPQGESIVRPRSHCRNCGHTLTWWENVPLLSWLALRGRCRTCGGRISWRYPLVEALVAALWATVAWQTASRALDMQVPTTDSATLVIAGLGRMAFFWILIALAFLDAEHLWLPDWLTLPGLALGFVLTSLEAYLNERAIQIGIGVLGGMLDSLFEIALPAAILLVIRWLYWIVRHRQGLGLGDVKLIAMLGAWLGVWGAFLALVLGVVLGALTAIALLTSPKKHRDDTWAMRRLPLGTFLCVGGIVSDLWGAHMISAYRRWAGF